MMQRLCADNWNTLLSVSAFCLSVCVIWDSLSVTGPEVYDSDRFGSGEGDLYLENVQCDGSESRLEDCHVSGEQCSHSDAAGVNCQGKELGIVWHNS